MTGLGSVSFLIKGPFLSAAEIQTKLSVPQDYL